MPTTPTYAFRYPSPTDPADGPVGFQNLATDVETVLGAQLPAAGTMRRIADLTKSSAGTTFDFQSIPQTYASLAIDLNVRGDVAGPLYMTAVFNNTPGGSAYSRNFVQLGATYSGQFLTNQAAADCVAASASGDWGGFFSPYRLWFPEYTKTRAQSFISQGLISPTAHTIAMFAGMWSGTTAISAITLTGNINLTIGSRATLYGLGSA